MNFLIIFILYICAFTSISDLSMIKCPDKCKCEYENVESNNSNSTYNLISTIVCKEFLSFAELDFKSLNGSDFIQDVEILDLEPALPILLDNLLDLSLIRITKQVILRNIKGFLYNSNPFKNVELNFDGKSLLELRLFNSNFEFYESYSNKLESKCEMESFGNVDTILTKFSKLWLNDNIKYSSSLCPLVFRNTHFDLILAHFLNTSNSFSFKSYNNSSTYYINSNINYLYLFNVKLEILDSILLNKQVFGQLKRLQIFGSLNEVEKGLFCNFKSIKSIILELFNFDNFITNSNTNQWLNDLNENENKILLNLNDREMLYEYSDDDFCFFKNFPASNVCPIIKTKENLNCSCTLMWILRNYKNYTTSMGHLSQFLTSSVGDCLTMDEEKFEQTIKNCNFGKKLNECNEEVKFVKTTADIALLTSTLKIGKPKSSTQKIKKPIAQTSIAALLQQVTTKRLTFSEIQENFLKTTKHVSSFLTAKKPRSENLDPTLSTISLVMGGLGFLTISVILGVIMFFFK
jgi:hypothetical protein